MTTRLTVFISSVLAGHADERAAVADTLSRAGLADAWLFEQAPATSANLAESYLREVRACDLFVLLLKGTITQPVVDEYLAAHAASRPVLAFLDATVAHDAALDAFLSTTFRERYRTYRGLAGLRREVLRAVRSEGVRRFRRADVARGPRVEIGRVGGDVALADVVKGGAAPARGSGPTGIDLKIGEVEGDLAVGSIFKR